MKTVSHHIRSLARVLFPLVFAGFCTSSFAAPAAQPAKTVATNTKPAAPATKSVNPNQVNLNTASAAELQDKLVGIGAKKAQAIVEYREKNGAFSRVEQLTDVSGIGPALLERNRDRLVTK